MGHTNKARVAAFSGRDEWQNSPRAAVLCVPGQGLSTIDDVADERRYIWRRVFTVYGNARNFN
jgi:hypothetical protein